MQVFHWNPFDGKSPHSFNDFFLRVKGFLLFKSEYCWSNIFNKPSISFWGLGWGSIIHNHEFLFSDNVELPINVTTAFNCKLTVDLRTNPGGGHSHGKAISVNVGSPGKTPIFKEVEKWSPETGNVENYPRFLESWLNISPINTDYLSKYLQWTKFWAKI